MSAIPWPSKPAKGWQQVAVLRALRRPAQWHRWWRISRNGWGSGPPSGVLRGRTSWCWTGWSRWPQSTTRSTFLESKHFYLKLNKTFVIIVFIQLLISEPTGYVPFLEFQSNANSNLKDSLSRVTTLRNNLIILQSQSFLLVRTK